MDLDEAYKNKIGERLTRRIAQALEAGELTEENLPEVSSYILENIDKAKSNSELISFVEEISKKWPFFSDILTAEQNEQSEKTEENKEEKVAEVSELLKQNKIDEALKVVEDANNKDNGGVN